MISTHLFSVEGVSDFNQALNHALATNGRITGPELAAAMGLDGSNSKVVTTIALMVELFRPDVGPTKGPKGGYKIKPTEE